MCNYVISIITGGILSGQFEVLGDSTVNVYLQFFIYLLPGVSPIGIESAEVKQHNNNNSPENMKSSSKVMAMRFFPILLFIN